ncbi:hypothetical protein RND81_14G030500 [Saponaria officinalis]
MIGNDHDWYAILQVEQTADETLIKKQYRKFALLLHPDKNQFAGAEAAFKLIGEAQRILLDKEKRAIHDMKRRTSYKPVIPHLAPQQASRNAGVVRQSGPQNKVSNKSDSHVKASNTSHQGKTQQQPANGKETFWTLCLHCSVRYQYYKEVIGVTLRCQTCEKTFVAYDMHSSTSNVRPEAKKSNPTFDTGVQAGRKVEVGRSQKVPNKVDRHGDEGSKLQKTNGQSRKKQVESSESFESDGSSDSEEVEIHEAADPRSQRLDDDGDRQTRRSNRNKRHISYDENASNNEQVVAPSKKAKGNTVTDEKVDAENTFGSAVGEDGKKKESKNASKETLAGSPNKSSEAHDGLDSSFDLTPESPPAPTYLEYPDPEFFDFDKSREEHCFKVGQLWAAYDTVDAMPRYYAKIKKIFSSGFKLQITWLEPDPDDDFGIEWTNSELPFSCGKFMIGDTENTEDRLMFSHVVSGCKSNGRNYFTIYPKVGETWAIFKNWDAKWCSIPEKEWKFEYDLVEILSEYDSIVGIRVAPLVKLKGFASLFIRKSVNEMQIKPSEILRFSHMVPSYRTTGDERKDVPKGSIELDPASTTMNLEEITLPQSDKKNCVDDLSSNFAGKNAAVNVAGNSTAAHSENKKGSKVMHRNGVK